MVASGLLALTDSGGGHLWPFIDLNRSKVRDT